MSFWNNRLMDWFEGRLVTLTNYIWRKRRAAKKPAAQMAAPTPPSSTPKRRG